MNNSALITRHIKSMVKNSRMWSQRRVGGVQASNKFQISRVIKGTPRTQETERREQEMSDKLTVTISGKIPDTVVLSEQERKEIRHLMCKAATVAFVEWMVRKETGEEASGIMKFTSISIDGVTVEEISGKNEGE